MPKKPSRGVNCLFGTSGVFSDTGPGKLSLPGPQLRHQQPQKRRALAWAVHGSYLGQGSRFYARRCSTRRAWAALSFCGRRGRRKAPSRTEVTLGGALPPARGDLDDFVTSPMHDGTRWAVPRTARRAVVGLGVARRPAWVGHAAPIVTRGRHVFTEAGRVHGPWRAPRGDDSRPRSPPRS